MFLKKSYLLPLPAALVFIFVQTSWAERTNGPAQLWRLDLPGYGSESSCALAPEGTIYQGTFFGWLVAITPEGKVKWKFKSGREIKSSPAVAADGTVYFGSRDWKFYALTPTGKLKWTFATGAWVDSSPAIAADGTIYFGSWDKNFYALTPEGKLKWKFATSNLVTTSPAIATDGTIYFGSHDKNFYALAPDANLKWKFATGAEIDGSPSIAGDGTIYFCSTDGNLYALRPDGSELWHLHTGSYTSSTPVLDEEGNLYLASNDEQIAVSPAGKLIWHHPTQIPLDRTWAVAANGMVYVSQPTAGLCAMDRKNPWPPAWYLYLDYNLATAPNINPQGVIYVNDSTTLFAFQPTNAAPLVKSSWPMWRANPQHTGRVQPVENEMKINSAAVPEAAR
jgi:outer membrane protein assembly factor BamB